MSSRSRSLERAGSSELRREAVEGWKSRMTSSEISRRYRRSNARLRRVIATAKRRKSRESTSGSALREGARPKCKIQWFLGKTTGYEADKRDSAGALSDRRMRVNQRAAKVVRSPIDQRSARATGASQRVLSPRSQLARAAACNVAVAE